jgi:hypothetical protein
MSATRARKGRRPAIPELAPTLERLRHGPVDRFDRPIADDEGNPARPYKARDILAQLELRGSITADMRQAGEDFRAAFRTAQLDALKAADVGRPIVQGGVDPGLPWRCERSRRQVWETMVLLGGLTSHAGSCVWHVIGLEHSLRQWREYRGLPITVPATTGVLIGALSVMARPDGR